MDCLIISSNSNAEKTFIFKLISSLSLNFQIIIRQCSLGTSRFDSHVCCVLVNKQKECTRKPKRYWVWTVQKKRKVLIKLIVSVSLSSVLYYFFAYAFRKAGFLVKIHYNRLREPPMPADQTKLVTGGREELPGLDFEIVYAAVIKH